MKHAALVAASAGLLLPAAAMASSLVYRADSKGGDVVDDSKTKVCYPSVSSGTMAPCVEIATIESACQPNGTDAVDYQAHSQCMCKGSFFNDWRGCQDCLRVHGLRSERDNNYWDGVLSVASHALCSGTPTAVFRSLFASAEANTQAAPVATSGDTKSSDQFPGKTEVSLYYTATGSQGPGPITGSAATATKKATATEAPDSGSGITSGGSVTRSAGGNRTTFTSPSSGTQTGSAAPSSSTAAAPRDGAASGLAMAVAGAALMMAV
ncbi:Pyridoxal phosphate-dependent transferase, major domain protein [Purpureocillium lavendulum]|uniref:Pyridoxal phosphate-dependent transferase, major domain protein n=1 Tax=Purpureocillium lavendulum TaxID=1247861 RepID=A0AB34FW01_9HYPO|nr:Pyridoxal phosphate-dependent transferase, major domain protein [Purpureocillium lavendulum]